MRDGTVPWGQSNFRARPAPVLTPALCAFTYPDETGIQASGSVCVFVGRKRVVWPPVLWRMMTLRLGCRKSDLPA